MIIKKYQGKTEEEALENAKKELGEGIVLMNSKIVKRKGLAKLFKAPFCEVTVAKEEESETRLSKGIDIRGKEDTPISKSEENPEKKREFEIPEKTDGSIIEEKLDDIHLMLTRKIAEEDSIKEKESLHTKEPEIKRDTEEEEETIFTLVKNALLDNEVDSKIATSIVEEAERTFNKNAAMEAVLSHIYQRMILRFGKPEIITPAKEGPKVVFFVGTTGVGKTTTIAKIASKFIVEEKRKVALLTADTYRIAAAEQLRTYANILEIPFRVIYSLEDMAEAVSDFADYEYILVDTAGHSQKNVEQRDNMAEYVDLVKGKTETEVYLVLSATTKYKDLLSIVDNYSGIPGYKIIFTKLDETECYGNILNIKTYSEASLSYVTCGQNVPEDIDVFNPQSTVKKLLGGK